MSLTRSSVMFILCCTSDADLLKHCSEQRACLQKKKEREKEINIDQTAVKLSCIKQRTLGAVTLQLFKS